MMKQTFVISVENYKEIESSSLRSTQPSISSTNREAVIGVEDESLSSDSDSVFDTVPPDLDMNDLNLSNTDTYDNLLSNDTLFPTPAINPSTTPTNNDITAQLHTIPTATLIVAQLSHTILIMISVTVTSPSPTLKLLTQHDTLSYRASSNDMNTIIQSTSRQRTMPSLPSLINSPGSAIISLARADGFASSLEHRQHTPWFLLKNLSLFLSGGIIYRCKQANTLYACRKFKDAEKASHTRYNTTAHRDNTTGKNNEGTLPSYAREFLNSFSFWKKG